MKLLIDKDNSIQQLEFEKEVSNLHLAVMRTCRRPGIMSVSQFDDLGIRVRTMREEAGLRPILFMRGRLIQIVRDYTK